jgi:acetylornithine/succinyldiaminopimelate/putrescine aminotransferase
MTVAKALGGGLPIGACLAAPEFSDVLQPGDHGSTFAGGPLTATVALAVLEILDDPELLRRVRELGATLRERLEELDGVREVRGRGLMLGVALEDGIDAAQLNRSLLELGLVANVPEPGTIRMLPPLTIEDAELQRGVELFAEGLGALSDRP